MVRVLLHIILLGLIIVKKNKKENKMLLKENSLRVSVT